MSQKPDHYIRLRCFTPLCTSFLRSRLANICLDLFDDVELSLRYQRVTCRLCLHCVSEDICTLQVEPTPYVTCHFKLDYV